MSLETSDSTMSVTMGDLFGTPPDEVDVSHDAVVVAIEKLQTPDIKLPTDEDSRPTTRTHAPLIDNSDSDDEDTKSYSDDDDRPGKDDDDGTEDDDDKSTSDDGKDDEDDDDGGMLLLRMTMPNLMLEMTKTSVRMTMPNLMMMMTMKKTRDLVLREMTHLL